MACQLNSDWFQMDRVVGGLQPKQQAANAAGDRVVGGVVGVAVVDGGYRALHFRLILLPRLLRNLSGSFSLSCTNPCSCRHAGCSMRIGVQ